MKWVLTYSEKGGGIFGWLNCGRIADELDEEEVEAEVDTDCAEDDDEYHSWIHALQAWRSEAVAADRNALRSALASARTAETQAAAAEEADPEETPATEAAPPPSAYGATDYSSGTFKWPRLDRPRPYSPELYRCKVYLKALSPAHFLASSF